MAENIKLEKEVYSKAQFEKLVNVNFNQIDPSPTSQQLLEEQPTVEEFFNLYNNLFYDIPEYGSTNSHEYLIKTSKEYIDFDDNNEQLLALQQEIAELREQLLEEQKKVIELQTGTTIDIPTISAGQNTAGGVNVTNSY
tara:strand:+ start:6627 stop:7043 length:417 start_codon:yes stop_codon:yes gene_type:complete